MRKIERNMNQLSCHGLTEMDRRISSRELQRGVGGQGMHGIVSRLRRGYQLRSCFIPATGDELRNLPAAPYARQCAQKLGSCQGQCYLR